jgi:DNA-binding response OmpR family regulator
MLLQEAEYLDILLVDDDQSAYLGLSETARQLGLLVQQIGEGHKAIRLAARRPPRLWIANLALPDMSGLDLLQMVRAKRPNVPFYLVSDHYSAQDEVRTRVAGAAGYLSKPITPLWLEICRTSLKRMAVRAGPSHAPG